MKNEKMTDNNQDMFHTEKGKPTKGSMNLLSLYRFILNTYLIREEELSVRICLEFYPL